MTCPLCDYSDWYSVEKNKDGVNLRVQCRNCEYTYHIQFHSQSVDYRVADAYSHAYLMDQVKIPNDTGVFRVWVSQQKVAS